VVQTNVSVGAVAAGAVGGLDQQLDGFYHRLRPNTATATPKTPSRWPSRADLESS
jgi:hypothetical protein